ncbi:hypothetical protein ZIOFF_062785 [Zingiber officinale]|uniref:Uncharacterized protein n=1 Tax=Zingiber officinale TaxID=94328 RepID=A0A8J5KF87_ZINOF|nr:hypothetical protein ZIOFF_062785 [Zingiber officinale]
MGTPDVAGPPRANAKTPSALHSREHPDADALSSLHEHPRMLPTPSPHASTRDFLPCPNCIEVGSSRRGSSRQNLGMLPIWVFISQFGVQMVSA